jgi:glycosyltransferase involved in cell wall biosynthesis
VEIGDFMKDKREKVELEKRPEITVIIPTLNEEESIEICIKKTLKVFHEQSIDGEIIVSDSSIDNTPIIAENLGARVIKPDKKGYGYAYLYALKEARGEIIVFGDGDNTYDFLEIPKLIRPLQNGEADFVIGSRLNGEIKPGAMPVFHRYIGNPLLTGVLNIIFKAGISDAHCGMRAITKNALSKINLMSHGMEFASEMLILATRFGLKIQEVPISYYPRKGKSKLNPLADGWRHLKFMLFYAPTYLYFIPGIIMSMIGILLIVSAYLRIEIGFIPGLHSLIGGNFLIIIGYQTFLLGVMAHLWGEKAGFMKSDEFPMNYIRKIKLQQGILIGIGITLIGIISIISMLYGLISKGYTAIQFNYSDIFSYIAIIIGFLTIYNSFLISMIQQE